MPLCSTLIQEEIYHCSHYVPIPEGPRGNTEEGTSTSCLEDSHLHSLCLSQRTLNFTAGGEDLGGPISSLQWDLGGLWEGGGPPIGRDYTISGED